MPTDKVKIMRRCTFAAAGFILALAALFVAFGTNAQLLQPDDASVVAAGEYIYRQHCVACHGVNLEGQPEWRKRNADGRLPAPPHDESGHTWHHPDQMLFEMTKYGVTKFAPAGYKTDMLAYEELLSDEEIVAVLSYIKSRWPAEVKERHDEINQSTATN